MSTKTTAFVAFISLDNGSAYYACSAAYTNGFSMDGQAYAPTILSVGDAQKIGNFGEGTAIGACSMTLQNAELQYGDSRTYDISLPFNNGSCEIRIRDVDNDSGWADCDYYYKGTIKNFKIGLGTLSFDIDDMNRRDSIVLPKTTVESVVSDLSYLSSTDIPEDSVGMRIPMQFGDLSATASGHMGKGISISKKIGHQQIHFDTSALTDLASIGTWDDDLKRYFEGQSSGEYRIGTNENQAIFQVDTTTTITSDIDTTDGVVDITVADDSVLTWVDEDEETRWSDVPDLLSANVIAIDSELMLLVQKPDGSNTIWVERGFSNTTVAEHSSGAAIYQCAKYSAKNLLSFIERFESKIATNQFYGHSGTANASSDIATTVADGKWGNLVDNSTTTYLQLYNRQTAGLQVYHHINWDIKFPKLEKQYQFTKLGIAIKATITTSSIYGDGEFGLFDPSYNSGRAEIPASGNVISIFRLWRSPYGGLNSYTADTWDTPDWTVSGPVYFLPGLTGRATGNTISLATIDILNDKWKFYHYARPWAGSNFSSTLTLYALGVWAAFFTDFTKERIVGPVQGRKVTAAVDTICGSSSVNTLAEHPLHVLALILTGELGYSADDFDTTLWQAAYTYSLTFNTDPECALSYGIDEKMAGWDLCQEIAAQFLFTLIKTDAGKIGIVSLHQRQNTNPAIGYPSLTAYEIPIWSIVMNGDSPAITIAQTGTDRIRNDVIVHYNRNNSTDDYQSVYTVADAYTLTESGASLSNARLWYYGGHKTEPWEVDAFAIYNATDAQRCAEWHINDKAEVGFWITCTLPAYHYSDINSKSTQYQIGDIVYLNGIYEGQTFNSTHKFVIRNISKTEQGRAVQIEAKSIEPISEF